MKIPKDKLKYVDIPEIAETFVDSARFFTLEGQLIRMELCVIRMDEPAPPKQPTARQYPACRLVITAEAAVDIYNQLQSAINVLAQQGIVKQEQTQKETVQ